MSSEPHSAPTPSPLSASPTALAAKIRAALLGGALGDALGAVSPAGSGEDSLSVSSHTQLALYSLDGLLEAVEWANSGVGADETACIWLAYLRWLRGRGIPLPETGLVPLPRPIDAEDLLQGTPAGTPDPEVVSALSSGEMGTRQRPVNTVSPSPAALVRSAPFGLLPYVPAETVYKLALDAASLTHGHPVARSAAAVFAVAVHGLLSPGTTLVAAAGKALEPLRAAADSDDVDPGLAARLTSVISGAVPDGGAPDGAAAGTAEDVLAVGLAAALRAEASMARQAEAGSAAAVEDTVTAALREAAAAGGAPAAVVTGSLLGALFGELPGSLLASLRERAAVERLADSFISATLAP